MEPRLLRPREAARALATSRSTLYQLIRSGAIRSVRVGSTIRVPVESIEDFIRTGGCAMQPGRNTP